MIALLERHVAGNIWVATLKQNLGCYLIGQGHSMTLKQNRFQTLISLFEVGF